MSLDFKTMLRKYHDGDAKLRFLEPPPDFSNHFVALDYGHAQRMKIPSQAACPICVPNYQNVEPEEVPYGQRMGFLLRAMKSRYPAEYTTVTTPLKHRKRSNQSENYHRKVQKRWTKRGLTVTKTQEVMDPIVLKLSNIAMHKLTRAVRERHWSVKVKRDDLHIDLDGAGFVFIRKNNA